MTTPIRTCRHRLTGFLLGAAGVLLAACTTPEAAVQPGGTLDVLGPFPGFANEGLPDSWVFEGDSNDTRRLSATTLDNIPALKIENTQAQFSAVLRTKALLLATPYLSWTWNMETAESGDHPVRLVVGFWRGEEEGAAWNADLTPALAWPGGKLPPHQRAITIAWADTALARGTLTLPKGASEGKSAPRYVARGGRESTGQWWLETVDLADLFARAWPGEDRRQVRISFIGITSEGGRTPTLAHISGVRLSR